MLLDPYCRVIGLCLAGFIYVVINRFYNWNRSLVLFKLSILCYYCVFVLKRGMGNLKLNVIIVASFTLVILDKVQAICIVI